ncbi:hypothetical protein [Nocardioides sp.]|uniref:hypothetical protein n=1 Tax=Nocardioides sp. TaxID=35761 RepID=UPI0037832A9F
MTRAAVLVPALLLVVSAVTGCGGSEQDDYCAAVKEHQQELSDIVGSGDPDALLRALGTFRDLQGRAPGDITDEWQQVVTSLEALQQALEDAGVDPATYDRAHPPAGLTPAEKARIDAAAAQLGSGTTLRALQDLDQQARDVCKTPLTL